MKWIPVATVAKRLGVSRQRVYDLIKLGELGWRKVDGTVLVSTKTVEQREERINENARR